MSQTKQNVTHKRKLIGTALGKGGPDFMGFTEYITAARRSESVEEWMTLVETVVNDPGEWYNRKFYYNDPEQKQNFATMAGLFSNQGHTQAKSFSPNVERLVERIREVCKLYRGKFEVTYTRIPGPSDDKDKGPFMHVVYVKFSTRVPVDRKSVMATHSGRRDSEDRVDRDDREQTYKLAR